MVIYCNFVTLASNGPTSVRSKHNCDRILPLVAVSANDFASFDLRNVAGSSMGTGSAV